MTVATERIIELEIFCYIFKWFKVIEVTLNVENKRI